MIIKEHKVEYYIESKFYICLFKNYNMIEFHIFFFMYIHEHFYLYTAHTIYTDVGGYFC